MPRTETRATIVNKLGLHARPAMSFVDLAGTFACDVRVRKDDNEVDGKSIMMMMMLAAAKGAELVITCDGDDAETAASALKKLVDAGFDEE
ncbi:MAG: HPr family phosphocarrier protein [Phycisphaeraceae bacterium]|nr:MAG: HPr family phosphocarrier protein [Phycisphaeraceae bacterium]